MRGLHGGANRAKELEALAYAQTAAVAVLVDRQAVDVLHHQVHHSPIGSEIEHLGRVDGGATAAGRQVGLDAWW